MWKLILKNLWSRRRRNGWLLAELILVAILSWYIFDPVMVVTYERHLPLGYDAIVFVWYLWVCFLRRLPGMSHKQLIRLR